MTYLNQRASPFWNVLSCLKKKKTTCPSQEEVFTKRDRFPLGVCLKICTALSVLDNRSTDPNLSAYTEPAVVLKEAKEREKMKKIGAEQAKYIVDGG